MSTKKFVTQSKKETQELAAKFAGQILQQKPKSMAVVLALEGDLGSGKTTFVQGFAKGLGIKEKVLSPTFILMRRFKAHDLRFKNFYHVDCYRLKNGKDLKILGFKEIISNPNNIVAIEWPEKVSKVLPRKTLKIKFKHLKENQRSLTISR